MIEFDREIENLIKECLGAAIEVQKILGPGHLESVYERAFCRELTLRGISFQRQVIFNIEYKGESVGEGRMDLVVGKRLVIELKAIEKILPIHEQQTVAYLKVAKERVALLLNFNVVRMKDGGIHRVI
ncbi:MAG: GxxExxY protein [Planctomycetes bacterium]|nr:GxxExxY protein [Planctomycetota bacterium]